MLNCFGFGINNKSGFSMEEHRERLRQIATKLLKGNRANVAKDIFFFLLSKADNTGAAYCSIFTISEQTRYGEGWIKIALNLCIKTGLITKVGSRGGAYKINYEITEKG